MVLINLCKTTKTVFQILQTITMFELLNDQLLIMLKIKFDSSLEKSWFELFRTIKSHGPKNTPMDVPGAVISKDEVWGSVLSIY